MVGQPRSQPTLIGMHQVPTGMHGLSAWRKGRAEFAIPTLQGLSTLGGEYCHDLFPLLSPTSMILHKPHQSHLTNPCQNFPDLISPLDQSQLHLTGHRGPRWSHPKPPPEHHLEQTSLASEMEWPSKIMWSSCDNCATTCHLCHLVSRPSSWRTWT